MTTIIDMDRQERLKEAYSYLRGIGKVHTQKEFALTLGKAEGTMSRAFKGDEKALTDNLFMKISSSYPNTFNLDWLLTGKGEMLLDKEEPEHESTIVDLYAKLIKEHEAMRQQTKDALDEINKLKKQYEDSVIMLKDVTSQLQSLMKHVPRIYPTLEEQNPSLAADTQASCLDIRQNVKEK